MSLRALLRALGRNRTISEYIATESTVARGYRLASGEAGLMLARSIRVRVFVDSRVGRGSAELHFDSSDTGDMRIRLEAAAAAARSHQGPPWQLRPAAAPARVEVLDRAIDEDAEAVAERLWKRARKLSGKGPVDSWAQTVETRTVASNGFDNRYRSSAAMVRGRVGSGDRVERFAIRARRLSDIRVERTVDEARRRGARKIERTPRGRYRLVIRASALGDEPTDSLLAPLVQLSDPERYRLGIGRSRLGDQVADRSLSLMSDGTRAFGLASRPFADDSSATRRWSIIDSGKLAGLALGARDSALLRRESNGGVGNLELVVPRLATEDLLSADELPVLILDKSSWRRTDPATGALALGVGRGRVVAADGKTTEVAGGIASAPSGLFDEPKGSLEDAESTWFTGPATLRLGTIDVA